MRELTLATHGGTEMTDVTSRVQEVVSESGTASGLCVVFVPHTTAAVTINENGDPAVPRDIAASLERQVPLDAGYEHGEGNSAAHIKAALVGSSVTIPVEEGRLRLGAWQGIFFCEFDGPRQRRIWIQVK